MSETFKFAEISEACGSLESSSFTSDFFATMVVSLVEKWSHLQGLHFGNTHLFLAKDQRDSVEQQVGSDCGRGCSPTHFQLE